jgi:hypothetical protein
LWRPKVLGPAGFVLNMWIGGGNRSELEDRYEGLQRLFLRTRSIRTVTRTMADGTQRTCLAEVVSGLTPIPLGSTGMRLSVEFKVPSGRWVSTANTTVTGTAGSATSGSPKVVTLTGEIAVATAPLDALVYTVTGPIQNLYMADTTEATTGGDYFAYNATIGVGQGIVVDNQAWTVTGTGGLTVTQGAVQFSGSRFLTVQPAKPGSSPKVSMYGSGGMSTATNLSMTGPATYLA